MKEGRGGPYTVRYIINELFFPIFEPKNHLPKKAYLHPLYYH